MPIQRKNLLKTLLIIGVAIIAIIAINTTIFAYKSNRGKGGAGDGGVDNEYTCFVTFDAGNGTISGNRSYRIEIDKNTTVARPTEIPFLDGYVFWGWNATGNISDPMWQFDAQKITDDVTIYAVWAKELTVTFYADDGSFDDGTDERTVTAVYGTKVTAPKIVAPDEFTELQYWETRQGTEFDLSNDCVYDDLYLYARWDLKSDVKRALAPFEYNVTEKGYNVYSVANKNATALTVPSIVTSISMGAFAGCDNLTSIVISDSVTEIEQNAFQNCKKLKSVTLPSGLTSIEDYTFDGCSSLEDIVLPDTVTEVGTYAFRGCSSLTSITVPRGVTEVKARTFNDCTALRRVRLSDSVTKIGSDAFAGCMALTDIQIPVALEELGVSAFEDCASLKSITIPATCKSVDKYAFKDCTALTSARFHCEKICDGAFMRCTALTDITFGAEVRNIGAAFDYCTALTEVDIPDTVTTLSAGFCGCTNLHTVKIGDGVEEIGTSAFVNCYSLRNVTIGSSVKKIGFRSFEGCISLLSITIPSNVEYIETWAFNYCYKLVEVYNLSQASYSFGSSVVVHTDATEESIIHKTDDGFSFAILNDRTFPNEQVTYLMDYWGDDEDVVLPDSYNGDSYKVYQYGLAYKPNLKSVKFSAGVTDVGYMTLLGSDNVTSLTVADGNKLYASAGNCVIWTNSKVFKLGCKTSVIPDDGSVTAIGAHVFCRNATITSDAFRIPDSVTSVLAYAFEGCDGLIRKADNGLQYVDKWVYAFKSNSTEPVDLELDEGTVGMCNNTFRYDNSRSVVRSVKFNAELKYVGSYAFEHCNNLAEVIMNDGLLTIGGGAFYECSSLKEVVIPDSVNKMYSSVFSGCSGLEYVKLSAGITSVKFSYFDSCDALQIVIIPQSVNYFAGGALNGCPETVAIYYEGTEEQWNAIQIVDDNTVLKNATKYFYSETEIEGGNCWHYDADGKPTTVY
ncbi:MAG: leucine-rich repeat protein [Clostridiales bacterium]|nr:leucine-rich repeat protein [Clostridiales bacterium]